MPRSEITQICVPDLLQQAKKSYEGKLPVFRSQIAMASSNTELDDACLRFGDILRQPFEYNHRPRLDRYRYFWDDHLDSLAKQRSKLYRKWKRRGEGACTGPVRTHVHHLLANAKSSLKAIVVSNGEKPHRSTGP